PKRSNYSRSVDVSNRIDRVSNGTRIVPPRSHRDRSRELRSFGRNGFERIACNRVASSRRRVTGRAEPFRPSQIFDLLSIETSSARRDHGDRYTIFERQQKVVRPVVRLASMNAEIVASTIGGMATAPPSKSYTHRAILAAGSVDGTTRIDHPLVSADTRATVRAVVAFGGTVEEHDDTLEITGFGRPATPDDVIDCANSGTTIRLTTATAALADGLTVLTGDESLRARPQGPLLDAIESLGG